MRLIINIEKRYAFAILGAVLLLAVAIGVYAYTISPGTVPNPGHTLTSIQGLFSGDNNLSQTLSTKFCQTDGTNCHTSGNCALNCSETGKYTTYTPLIGNACQSIAFGGKIIGSRYSPPSGYPPTAKYYEVCCKVDC